MLNQLLLMKQILLSEMSENMSVLKTLEEIKWQKRKLKMVLITLLLDLDKFKNPTECSWMNAVQCRLQEFVSIIKQNIGTKKHNLEPRLQNLTDSTFQRVNG